MLITKEYLETCKAEKCLIDFIANNNYLNLDIKYISEKLIESKYYKEADDLLRVIMSAEQIQSLNNYHIYLRDQMIDYSKEAQDFLKNFYKYLDTIEYPNRWTEYEAFKHFSEHAGYSWRSVSEVYRDASLSELDNDEMKIKLLRYSISLITY